MQNLILGLAIASVVFNSSMETQGIKNEIENKESNSRIENGYLISFVYNEMGDYITSTIVTDDGNVWEVDGYVCNRGAKLEITFDTMDTDDITDDQIVKIIATVEK